MSRAERRAYKRLTKNQDPYALPGGSPGGRGARRSRVRARRQRESGEFAFFSTRFLAWLIGGAVVAGLLGLSVAWPQQMPTAAYAGIGAAVAWLVLAMGVRLMQRRSAAQRQAAAERPAAAKPAPR
ncbi:MAG TPA: hypothetical protein VHU77_12925 [Candidatus Limnocylindria bacterium]|jgi:hypothetical protein|nr:hypothetical protein [Candidatus Limnocylindria bacterium]